MKPGFTFNRTIIFGAVLFGAAAILGAQETSLEDLPGLRERAVVVHMVSRIVEQNQQVVWDSEISRVTIPGRPVGLRLEGADLVVMVQFTPFLRPDGQHFLVAQSQILINIPGEGMSYQTTLQTIPLAFGEEVYFFPLGSMDADDEARIEIQLALEPYMEGAPPMNADSAGNRNNGRRFGNSAPR